MSLRILHARLYRQAIRRDRCRHLRRGAYHRPRTDRGKRTRDPVLVERVNFATRAFSFTEEVALVEVDLTGREVDDRELRVITIRQHRLYLLIVREERCVLTK